MLYADLPARAAGLVLVGGALLALWTLPLLHLAENRLVTGTPVAAGAALGAFAWPIAVLAGGAAAALAIGRNRAFACAALVFLSAALLLLAAALGGAASELIAGQPAAARARPASGAWIVSALLAGGIALAAQRTRIAGSGWLALAGVLAGLFALGSAGRFEELSIAVEYRARSATIQAATVRHVALSASAVALAIVVLLLRIWRRARGFVDLAVSGIQVVPAVALFGALVAAASWLLSALPSLRDLGLSALGPAPAVAGIAAYLLLPLWRGLHAGLQAPDPAAIDAAEALGLTRMQVLRRVRLPLGAPILVGGLRVAAVQSIGLATLGALIGAGGLGSIVFDGMGQFASDLILLGAIPVIALSLAADRALAFGEAAAHRRWRG